MSANKVFKSIQDVIDNENEVPTEIIVHNKTLTRKTVGDTDIGKEIKAQIACLEELLKFYKNGNL